MGLPIPLYPLVVLPVAAAAFLFWRRFRLHVAVLRRGRPLDRTDRPLARIMGVVIYVLAQRRLLNDLGPGLTHAFIFWGFLVLLATTGNYLTNGLLETIVGWPLGGILWTAIVALANLLIVLILVALAYAV
ncbi:MAG: hypothetical protein M3O93_06220, partial [Chloroflexota bacterium]|nr:hypothetical protein [Chloroflexota bacterium]